MARKTEQDPAGQRDKRKKFTSELVKRLKKAKKRVVARFKTIPKNLVPNLLEYQLTPVDQLVMQRDVRAALNEETETEEDDVYFFWWFRENIEQPYRIGTLEQINEINQAIRKKALDGAFVQEIDPGNYVRSQRYREGLKLVEIDSYNSIKSLSSDTAKQVIQEINAGIRAGENTQEITARIKNRFDVAEGRAKRIVDTEVNKAFNDAKLRVIEDANKIGVETKVMHISALLPTTRPHHAARHMKVYTTAQQTAWWNEGVNRINCYCTVRGVVENES